MAKKGKKGKGPTPMSEPPGSDWNVYATFVLYAVAGLMAEADALMQAHRSSVERVAKYLRARRPPRLKPVWRGVVLAPEEAQGGKLRFTGGYEQLTFVSFSEDRDVACWFADPRSPMSFAVTMQKGPGATGYLIQAEPKIDQVLFHHSWAERFMGGRHLADLARMHPHLSQIEGLDRSLRHQQEVILKPAKGGYDLLPMTGCPPTDQLSQRFWPDGPKMGNPGPFSSRRPPRRNFLFCYGSNSVRRLNERLGRSGSIASRAYAEGYKRVFRGWSNNWNGGVATLIRKTGSVVYGWVTWITDEDLDRLDVFEGVNSGNYKRSKIKVTTINASDAEEEVTAVVYLATSREFNAPSREYLEACAETVGQFWSGSDGQPVTWRDFEVS